MTTDPLAGLTFPLCAVGVDPGATAGVVCLEVPNLGDESQYRWIVSYRIVPSASAKLNPVSRDWHWADRFAALYRLLEPRLIVVEDPIDARPYWGAKSRGTPFVSGETRYRSGVSYMAAIAGAPSGCILASYPVRGRKGRPGWMRVSRGFSRVHLLARLRGFARAIGCTQADELSEHELMALGVLRHHLETLAVHAARQAREASA